MAVTRHMGTSIPTADESFDPDDKRWVWFSWPAAILSSEFILPEGWVNHGEQTGVDVVDRGGKAYSNCNGILLSTTATRGAHVITNRVAMGDEELDRSVSLIVRDN